MAQICKESANELPSLSSVPRGLIVTRVSTDDPEVGSLAQKSRPRLGDAEAGRHPPLPNGACRR